MSVPDEVADIIRGVFEQRRADQPWFQNTEAKFVLNWLDSLPAAPKHRYVPETVLAVYDALDIALKHAFQTGFESALEYAAEQAPAAPEPDWALAPEWAQWWSVFPSGLACWWAEKPEQCPAYWNKKPTTASRRDADFSLPLGVDWRTTLRERPE